MAVLLPATVNYLLQAAAVKRSFLDPHSVNARAQFRTNLNNEGDKLMKTTLAVAALALVVDGGTAWAANSAPPVTVANPSLNVNVANTPLPVSVTNATTNQNVTVTNTSPLPVTVSPTEEPFQVSLPSVAMPSFTSDKALVTVPTGKMLVVEHVSFQLIATGAPHGLIEAFLHTDIGNNNLAKDGLVCQQIGANDFNQTWACSVQTKFYAHAGETLSFAVQTLDVGGTGNYFITVSGHYAPAP